MLGLLDIKFKITIIKILKVLKAKMSTWKTREEILAEIWKV